MHMTLCLSMKIYKEIKLLQRHYDEPEDETPKASTAAQPEQPKLASKFVLIAFLYFISFGYGNATGTAQQGLQCTARMDRNPITMAMATNVSRERRH